MVWNQSLWVEQRTKHFLTAFEEALNEAKELVMQRDVSGRNLLISPYEMFPNGPQDVLFLLFMKVGRAIGHQRAGQWERADEEVADILAYAAFYKAVRTDWQRQAQSPQARHVVDARESASERPAEKALRWFQRGGVQALRKADNLWHVDAGEGGLGRFGLCGYSCPKKDAVTRYYEDLYVAEDPLCPSCLKRIP